MIMSYGDWLTATEHAGNALQRAVKGRGRIALVDTALLGWHEHKGGSVDVKTAALLDLLKETKRWMDAKTDEAGGKSTERRLQAVRTVHQQAWAELQGVNPAVQDALRRFVVRKAAPGPASPTAAMSGVYAHERALYVQNDKKRAPSATKLHDTFDEQRDKGKLKGIDYKDISLEQFRKLDELAKAGRNVIYLKKMQRLQFMVWPQGGLLCHPDGRPVSTTRKLWIYAADRFGNFFSFDHRNYGDAQSVINHSTLNSGREVLGAGWIVCDNGVLTMINNNSGHYKPTPEHLRRVLSSLDAEGLDLRQAEADVYTLRADGKTIATTYDALPWMRNPLTTHPKREPVVM